MAGPPAPNVRHLLTRRRLLKIGVGFAGVVVAAGGTGAWLMSDRPAGAGRRALSDGEAGTVGALADVYFPPGGALAVSSVDVDVVAGADEYVAGLYPRDRRGIRALLVAVEQWPRLSLQSSHAFSSLPRPERAAVLAAFDDSGVAERRQLGSLLRALVAMPFFDDARALAALDVVPGCGTFTTFADPFVEQGPT